MNARFVSEHPQHPVELELRVSGIVVVDVCGRLRQAQEPSQRRPADQAMLAEIGDIHTSSGAIYGPPRVHAMRLHVGSRSAANESSD
ncbi:hypothetical protein [Nocardia asteroides]|uniref:hypothetical protein n=1 Tax=Nocardia asteroides TaxID=1824 RepID=UPI0034372ACC